MLTLILLIVASAILIAGGVLAMANDLSPAELATEVASFFRRSFRPWTRSRNE